jgi:hypothetical protein
MKISVRHRDAIEDIELSYVFFLYVFYQPYVFSMFAMCLCGEDLHAAPAEYEQKYTAKAQTKSMFSINTMCSLCLLCAYVVKIYARIN